MRQPPLLSVRNLTTRLLLGAKSYPVVDRVSFDLFQGKTLALVGESGCGKSMTALSLLRILPSPPALEPEGEVIYRGRNLLSLKEREMRAVRGSKIAMIFQDPMAALNPLFTLGDQLGEVIDCHLKLGQEEKRARILEALKEVKIPDPESRMRAYPHQLSGGMKQRAMIAMALLCKPDLLIADEPTTALDVTTQARVLCLMKELQKSLGMALLLITHDMGVVAEMADEVAVMYATRRVEKGSLRAVFQKRAHPYTQGLFNSLPRESRARQRLLPIAGSVPSIKELPSGCPFHPRCPYVMPICLEGEVPDFALKEAGHTAKCWLYDKDPARG